MKKFASIAAVVGLLLASALYYGNLKKGQGPEPGPDPEPIEPVVTKPEDSASPSTKQVVPGTLVLTSAISNGYIAQSASSDVYASVDIDAVKFQGAKRPSLNVALVIDRSGSMSGEKLRNAKQAARRLLDLLGAQDRVAIVSYSNDMTIDFASRPVDPLNREMMLRAIDALAVAGGTNISEGYRGGLSEVLRWKTSETINRVILLSDGNATLGMVTRPELEMLARDGLKRGVSMTSMGVGLDYNENIMTGMANEGAGNYYFIDDSAAIASVFEKELKGLASTVARNTALVITLEQGVTLEKLYGFPYRQVGDELRISLAEFTSEQSKNVLLKLRVKGDAAGARDVMSVKLSYGDVIHANKPTHAQSTLVAVTTTDAAKVRERVDTSVISRVQQVEIAHSMQRAMDLYEQGAADEAVQTITAQQERVRRARRAYKLKGESFDRVDTELSDINRAIQAAPAASAGGRRMIKAKKARSNYIMFDESAF
ncbi:MAG: VWA domain-containing protein [Myxococcota bacterium]